MISTATIGAMSLNASFVLYLLVYLPQIIHNRNPHHIASLSVGMHFILYSSYCMDLFYGFSSGLQWQYKTVSIIGLMLLTIQHLQIMFHHSRPSSTPVVPRLARGIQRSGTLARSMNPADKPRDDDDIKAITFNFNLFFIITAGTAVLYFFVVKHASIPEQTTQAMGYLSRAGFLIYTLPQIMKNRALQSAHAISIKFIYLSLALSCLDMTSAWCLDWGWPNKLGSPLTISLMLVMLMQMKKYTRLHPAEPVAQNCNFI